MKLRRAPSPFRFLIWLLPLSLIAIVIFNWDSLVGRVTQQSGPVDQTSTEESTVSAQPPIIVTEALGTDGFPVKARKHVLKYTVQPGDALLLIAERFKLSPNTILWANSETLKDNVDLILVGTPLYILPIDGVYHRSDGKKTIDEIAALYGVEPITILQSEFNDLSQIGGSDVPASGLRIVVPGGQRAYLTWQSPFLTGADNGQANPQGESHPGSCRERYTGAGGTGVYKNPVLVPYRITTGFEAWHPGVDLAADRDAPIYAADTGVIVFSGWHRVGYGELLIIDHGNGFTTYYGHLSKRFVGCGDQAQAGQLIGSMGATGNASGIHLHFEIRQNDAPLNPNNFIEIVDTRGDPAQP